MAKGYDYDLIVIGGGAAGLVASKFAAGIGRKVAIVEKSRLGGECTLFGCVPSKTLIRTAKVLHEMEGTSRVGLGGGQPTGITKSGVMSHIRSVVRRVYEGHRPEVLERQGIEIIIGGPRFEDNHHIRINSRVISSSRFIICTGSSPFVPPLKGLDSVPYLTNDNVFDMEALPGSMIILGGGPIGIEMAQAFHYLGMRVTIVEMAKDILVREDKELRELLDGRLRSQGITLRTGDILIPKLASGEPLQLECQHFIESIATNTTPRSDGMDGLRVVKVLEAGSLSLSRGGEPVALA